MAMMFRHVLLMFAASCVAWMLFPAGIFAADIGHADGESTVLDSLTEDGRFENLVLALRQTGLDNDLETGGPFTLFAPTDYAFDSLREEDLDALLADLDALQATLRHHMLRGKLTAYELTQTGSASTELGTSLTLIQHGNELMVNGAIIEREQVEASNAAIFVINRVLIPPADAQLLAERAMSTTTEITVAETIAISEGRPVSETQGSVSALQEDSMSDGGGLLSGPGELLAFALLLLFLAGGVLTVLRL